MLGFATGLLVFTLKRRKSDETTINLTKPQVNHLNQPIIENVINQQFPNIAGPAGGDIAKKIVAGRQR